MKMCRTKRKRYGFLITETIVTITVLSMLLLCLGVFLGHFKTFNDYHLTQQRCISAAQAQLDSISATGRPIAEEDISRLWQKVSTVIEIAPGLGQWKNLQLVKVKASAKRSGRIVSVEMARYILPQREIN